MPRHAAVWPARLPLRMNPPATPLWANLAISAWRYPEKTALVFMGKRWTYRELMAASEQMAGHLARLGVRKGDRVLLDMQNCPQLVITHFAILRLGCRPLGELLFQQTDLERSDFEFARTPSGWARRCVFRRQGAPLLLTEYFLAWL